MSSIGRHVLKISGYAPALPTPFSDDDTIDAAAFEGSRRIRDWLLSILRFAVTLEQCDQAAVMSLAAEMDRLGSGTSQSRFGFFTRTTTNFCACIVAKGQVEKAAELRLHIKRINNDRLRRAFEAVLFDKRIEPAPSRKLDREDLWKGLAAR
jgi:hypothetical protein